MIRNLIIVQACIKTPHDNQAFAALKNYLGLLFVH